MNKLGKALTALAAFAAIAPAVAADTGTPFYGRAGLPVADQRVQQIATTQTQAPLARTAAADAGYGRAGGVGAEQAVRNVTPTAAQGTTTHAAQLYGRAGGTAPFGG